MMIIPLQASIGISFVYRVEAQNLPEGEGLPDADEPSLFPAGTLTGTFDFSSPAAQQALTATGEGATESSSGKSDDSVTNDFGSNNTASPTAANAEGVLGEALSCSVSSILSTILTGVLGGLGTAVSSLVPDSEVPVKDSTQRAKETGQTIFGIPILPSWDAIAYCLGNLILAYIGQATVQWINTGFGGNPAFVTDPSQFFGAIADIETEKFLYELGGGFLCTPHQDIVRRNITLNTLSTYQQNATCTYNSENGSLEDFIGGNTRFSLSDWRQAIQPQNTWWGAQQLAERELARRINEQNAEQYQLLDWGRGFFSHRGEDGLINTIGSLIVDQASHRLQIPIDRAANAQGINQIITELLNAVFRVALNEILSEN